VASRGTAIAHCPLSNAYFSAEPFHLREALQHGVKVGLGTDIAGGYSIDIMNTMRHAVAVSRMREGSRMLANASHGDQPPDHGVNGGTPNLGIDWKEALYLATQGGVQALGLPLGSGMFEVGSPFDAQLSELRILLFEISSMLYCSSPRSKFEYLTPRLGLVSERSTSLIQNISRVRVRPNLQSRL